MSLRFYNTLSRKKEEFVPLEEGHVRMYTCGPTVYDDAHIGNYRTYLFEDLLRRTLKYLGFKVTQVMNLTDVDDKTIKRSQEREQPLNDFTAPIIQRFFKDLDKLNIERAEVYPAATEHIPEMIDLVQNLLDEGYAYIADGSVYFSIEKFAEYGRLSGMKMENMARGVRIDADEYEKDDFRDFALWRGWTEEDGDVFWDAPFGKGRPGWHVECSAMSMKYLGEEFDIHTGGVDNLFPHHENEIAQSVCVTGKQFVKYWLHSAHLIVNGEKMAKSLGNFYTVSDIEDQGQSMRALRYALISSHYRQKINLTDDLIASAEASLERLDSLKHLAESANGDGKICEEIASAVESADLGYKSALEDDLNISRALSHVFELVSKIHQLASQNLNSAEGDYILDFWRKIDSVLGVLFPKTSELPADVKALVLDRLTARKTKDWAKSDEIRDKLTSQGFDIKDLKEGTEVKWSKGREIVK